MLIQFYVHNTLMLTEEWEAGLVPRVGDFLDLAIGDLPGGVLGQVAAVGFAREVAAIGARPPLICIVTVLPRMIPPPFMVSEDPVQRERPRRE